MNTETVGFSSVRTHLFNARPSKLWEILSD